MALLQEAEGADQPASMFDFNRSLAAYAARQAALENEFDAKVAVMKTAIEHELKDDVASDVLALASRSGLPSDVLMRLKKRLNGQVGLLPDSIRKWIRWVFDWLMEDEDACVLMLGDVARAIRAATGRTKAGAVDADILKALRPGVVAWIRGKTVSEIEIVLGGKPNDGSRAEQMCPRSRELIGTVIPRSLSFILSIVSYTVIQLDPFAKQEDLSRELIESLSTAVRLGFDNLSKLRFATESAIPLGRVQAHKLWVAEDSA